MIAKSINRKSTEEIKTALEESMATARLPDGQGYKSTVATVFTLINNIQMLVIK